MIGRFSSSAMQWPHLDCCRICGSSLPLSHLEFQSMDINDIYVSVDVESDGPCPGIHSLLSIGAAAFSIDRKLLDTFSRNLDTIPDGKQNPGTMKFWDRFPEAYAATRIDTVHPETAFKEFDAWLKPLWDRGKPVLMGYPARFDIRWIDYYSWRYLDKNLVGLGAFDVKTAGACVLKRGYHNSKKRNYPRSWFTSDIKHTHIAIEDAIEQGEMAINLIRAAYDLPKIEKKQKK